jgi:DNA-binding MarR family transcriptional regulator
MSTPSPETSVDSGRDQLPAVLMRFGRMLHLLKASIHSSMSGMEPAAHGLLAHLVKGGPTRQGELAELAMLDPSTVSRHVATLVSHGLIERRIDQGDGRAVQLVATEDGVAQHERMAVRRETVFGEVFAGWDAPELAELVRLLDRLNDCLDATLRRQTTSAASATTSTTPTTDLEN